MTRRLEFITIVLASLLTGVGYVQQQAWGGVFSCTVLAAFWLFFSLRGIPHLNATCFLILAGLGALYLAGGAAPLIPFLGFLAGLAAWDLTDFSTRLKLVVPDSAAARLEKLHLTRLAATLAVGLAAGLAALYIHIQLSFIPAVILVILAFFSLAFAVQALFRKETDRS